MRTRRCLGLLTMLVDFRIGLSIYSGDCPRAYHRQNPNRKRSWLGQWMPVARGDLGKYAEHRGRIRSIHFKNVKVTAPRTPRSYLMGYDDSEHCVQDVVFENVCINGKSIHTPAEGDFTIENAGEIQFVP